MTDIKPPVITLTAGPVQGYANVLQAMARPLGYDYDPGFQAFYEETARKCAEALRWLTRVSRHISRICFYLQKTQ